MAERAPQDVEAQDPEFGLALEFRRRYPQDRPPYGDSNAGNPKREKMNNFYLHLPGGGYRIDADIQDSVPNSGVKVFFERCAKWVSQPREKWPKKLAGDIEVLRTKLEILEAVDDYLTQRPDLLERWQALRPVRSYLSYQVVEEILRPVYVELRKEFSQEQLIA